MMNPFRGHHLNMSNDDWDIYRQYSTYPGPEPHRRTSSSSSSTRADVGSWDRPGTSFQNWHNEEQETEDPDGQPYEPEEDEEDPELARKRKELQVIEEQIMLKKAAIALKNVDLKTTLPGVCNEEKSQQTKTNETLRERVNLILELRHRRGFGSKLPLPKTRKGSSINIQHDHPLKQRVQSALQQRFAEPSVEPENCGIPFLSATPPRQEVTPPEEATNQGFMRFLDILNKGVDIDELRKIVNADDEGVSHSSQNGGETSFFGSPPSVKRKKKEEEERPNTDEQQKHLQNVLESLGLSLGMDEMNRLADRTQERLYGKKQKIEGEERPEEDKTQPDSEHQQEGGEKYSPAHYTRSSSSSSSGSSSDSGSSSRTPSPFRRRRSPSSPRRQRIPSSPHRRRSSSSSHRRRSPSSSRRRRSPSSSRRRRSPSSPRRRRSPSSPRRRRSSSSPRRRRSSSSPRRRRSSSSPCRRRSSSSPRRRRSSSSPCRRRSSSSPRRRRSSSSPCRQQSPSSPCRWRSSSSSRRWRSPSSPRGLRSSCSPLRQRSSDASNHMDSHLQYHTFSSSQPYAYPSSHNYSTHPPPQMFPNAYSPLYNEAHYSQYAAYYNYLSNPANYWAYNQPPISGSNTSYNQNYPQIIPTILPNQQINPHNNNSFPDPPPEENTICNEPLIDLRDNSQQGLLPVESRCLVSIKKVCIANPYVRSEFLNKMTRKEQIDFFRELKAARKKRIKEKREKAREAKESKKKMNALKKELNNVIVSVKEGNSQTQGQTAGASEAQSEAQQNPMENTGPTKKKNRKKKKKCRVFMERDEEMERQLRDRSGPVTRALAVKNPAKLTEFEGKLVVINDVEDPLSEFRGLTGNITTKNIEVLLGCHVKTRHIKVLSEAGSEGQLLVKDTKLPGHCVITTDNTAAVERTNTEITTAEPGGEPVVMVKVEPEEKPVLTEEEIKANLKKKLEAFNNRMKKNLTQPAKSLTPQNLKVEDEI